ncbi:PepSY domain-containing protein [Actibacterium sp. MT2.3-13A]|uniref:PepSY domain-containing protein n=1 Tax=Actibacterium sp. MT2.3-13A TaxID=2828332 RepID=UPI001BA7F09B|nr:PepSY domain-containing protein [Actibacterium sp. MT2.3-13A]
MIRSLHRWPGLLAAALLVVLALSGAALSVLPAVEAARAPAAAGPGLSVAELTGRIMAAYPGVEQIRRAPSGRITAYWFEGGRPGAAVIDPRSGQGVASADTPAFEHWLTKLHRSLFLGDGGRIAVAAGAAAMLALALSGLALVARRAGGWRRIFAPLKGPLPGRLHVEIARLCVFGLTLSSATALWMSASTFGLLPEGAGAPGFPSAVSGQTGRAPASIGVLRDTPVSALRELTFPYPGDATDAFTLKTGAGAGYIDQGTGALLAWRDLGAWERATETVYRLHTGEGAALLGLILGLMALGVPVMAGTGAVIWVAGRRGRPRLRSNAAPGQADTIVLVGSEGGSSWGFAATLHAALTAAGQRVHMAPMSGFAPARYARAARIVVLAATYGEGAAPASARGFLDRLAALPEAPRAPLAVLGFGDRSFPAFCAFADEIRRAAEAKGWAQLLLIDRVDRQSPQDFARWGRALGAAMGMPLELNHQPQVPKTEGLTLVSRRDYGAEVQAPTAILRFALPRRTLWQRITGRGLGRFAAGDLLGILPEGSAVPRFYSLASASCDGFAEICVRKHPGGLCSGQLMELRPGQGVRAFLRRNPGFRPARGAAPVILVGAGTGIGPLAGFARANRRGRPLHLYFGARHPDSDLLYGRELAEWQAGGRLASVTAAFSRAAERAHVQDALRRDGARVARLIAGGAQVMVCGGREMAAGVAEALADILAPAGLTPAMLKAEGRYAEDVY